MNVGVVRRNIDILVKWLQTIGVENYLINLVFFSRSGTFHFSGIVCRYHGVGHVRYTSFLSSKTRLKMLPFQYGKKTSFGIIRAYE